MKLGSDEIDEIKTHSYSPVDITHVVVEKRKLSRATMMLRGTEIA